MSETAPRNGRTDLPQTNPDFSNHRYEGYQLNGKKHNSGPVSQSHVSIDADSDNDDGVGHHSLPHPSEIKRKPPGLKETVAGVAGNVLEWYDFAVFGYFSDIIADVFFPKQEGHAAIVQSFAVFGGAFFMRPIGGMMMGYIGDLYGRKRALEISIFLMAFPTFAMGCLPSYDQVGWVAIVLLAAVRLLQGLSVGGQLMSSLVFTLESHERSKWGLYGSCVLAAGNMGTLLGGIIGYVMRRALSYEQLIAWGWRVPFLSGIVVSLSGFYLKYHCEEECQTHLAEGEEAINPIIAAFGPANRRSLLASTLAPMLWSGGFYLSFVWMAIFMTDLTDNPVPQAFAVNAGSLLLSVVILFPLSGILSDKYGRRPVMTVGGVGLLFFGPLMVQTISLGHALSAFFAQSTLGILLSLWGAPMMAWLVESFPPEIRLTAVSIGYNTAQAFVGGLSPSIATWMVDNVGVTSPGYIYSTVAVLALTGLWIAPAHHTPCGETAPFAPISTDLKYNSEHTFTIDEEEKSEWSGEGTPLRCTPAENVKKDEIIRSGVSS